MASTSALLAPPVLIVEPPNPEAPPYPLAPPNPVAPPMAPEVEIEAPELPLKHKLYRIYNRMNE
jgi:hypothetical protein